MQFGGKQSQQFRDLHEVQNKAGGVRNNGTNRKELVIISIRVTGLITRLL